MSAIDAEIIDGPIRLLIWQLVGIGGLTALIAGLLGVVLSQRLLVACKMLEASTIRIGLGEPLPPLHTSVLEVNRIGDILAHASRELQQANDAREGLLYEVNHRVKNSLAVVTSILSMQARQTSDPREKRGLLELRSRIDVIARVHQSLYESGHHNSVNVGVFLKEVATTTMQALDSKRNCELNASVDSDVIMPVYRTTPLALIASELITNAIRHAQRPDGRCNVTMRFARDGENGLSLMIEDDGVGLAAHFDPQRSGGVGMRIITGLLKQLRAKMTTNAGEPGAQFLIILDEAHSE
jgi:two-component sensor histidine kinase